MHCVRPCLILFISVVNWWWSYVFPFIVIIEMCIGKGRQGELREWEELLKEAKIKGKGSKSRGKKGLVYNASTCMEHAMGY